ncbi:hypothetical protein HKX48_005296 [Thoreauomyces humboldtii]|nr:hypothetical protein HKX48_005296 [Thoreauomyces humboldtii]
MLTITAALLFAGGVWIPAIVLAAPQELHALDYDCSTLLGKKYSLASSDFNVTTTTTKKFGKQVTTLTGNPCRALDTAFDPLVKDTCGSDTWFCLTDTFEKTDAAPVLEDAIKLAAAAPEPIARGDEFDLIFKSTDVTVNLSITCGNSPDAPKLISHTDNLYTLAWTTKGACGPGETPPGNPSQTPVKGGDDKNMSGAGIFWTLIFVALLAYLVIGSAYNYTVFRIRSFPDILPHWYLWSAGLAVAWDFVATCWERARGSAGNYVRI